MEKKVCLECGEKIVGRVDKKFCNDACRNNYNNKQNADSNSIVRNINNTLRKNRRILEENLKGDTTKISKQKLIDKGFNFSYYTNINYTKNNHSYYFCYEYGYLFLENEFILIVKRKLDA